MPIYTYECTNQECNHTWDDFIQSNESDPDVCPKCGKNTVQKVFVYVQSRRVELYGRELFNKLRADGKQMQKDAAKSEKVYANMLGEDRYQSIQTLFDAVKKETD